MDKALNAAENIAMACCAMGSVRTLGMVDHGTDGGIASMLVLDAGGKRTTATVRASSVYVCGAAGTVGDDRITNSRSSTQKCQ